jgi:hypothetical protein
LDFDLFLDCSVDFSLDLLLDFSFDFDLDIFPFDLLSLALLSVILDLSFDLRSFDLDLLSFDLDLLLLELDLLSLDSDFSPDLDVFIAPHVSIDMDLDFDLLSNALSFSFGVCSESFSSFTLAMYKPGS